MEAAHVVGLEAPAKGTLEPPVGSDLDGGGCPAALQGVSGPLNGGGEPVVDVVVTAAVVGTAVVGTAVVGAAVVGTAVVGAAGVGTAVGGAAGVGTAVGGAAIVGGWPG